MHFFFLPVHGIKSWWPWFWALLTFWKTLLSFGSALYWPEHTSVTPVTQPSPLSSSLKILWLTLCQPHNAMEIEVASSLPRHPPTWQLTASFVQSFHFLRCFFFFALQYLPVYTPSQEEREDPALFANNVRKHMAKSVRLRSLKTLHGGSEEARWGSHPHLSFFLRPHRALDLPLIDLSFEDRDISLSRGEVQIFDPSSLLEFNRLASRLGWVQGERTEWSDRVGKSCERICGQGEETLTSRSRRRYFFLVQGC